VAGHLKYYFFSVETGNVLNREVLYIVERVLSKAISYMLCILVKTQNYYYKKLWVIDRILIEEVNKCLFIKFYFTFK